MDNESGTKGNRGELAEQILDRIASDSDFRQQLLNNPAETLKEAGYHTSDEVSGYKMMAAERALGSAPNPSEITTAMNCDPTPTGVVGGGNPSLSIGCGTTDPPHTKPKPGATH